MTAICRRCPRAPAGSPRCRRRRAPWAGERPCAAAPLRRPWGRTSERPGVG
nr:MAG TPA: hypothetical protein [Caudoviricetes sp.]